MWALAEKAGVEGAERFEADTDTPEIPGERTKKKAWGQKKVFNDICNHRAAGFPAKARDQWQTLKTFHETHTRSDTVPNVPFQLRGATGMWPITNGSPINWAACWSKLAWRCARSYKPDTEPEQAPAITDATTAAATDPDRRLTPAELLLANGITGLNASRADRNAAVKITQVVGTDQMLAPCLDSVVEGASYFVLLQPEVREGEFRVGLARAMETKSVGEGMAHKDVIVRVQWFARKEWLDARRKWAWSDTPYFERAKLPGTSRFWYSPEPLSCFIPVPVQVSPASLRPGNEHKPRLLSVCVGMLREVCMHRNLMLTEVLALRGPEEGEEGEEGHIDVPLHATREERIAAREAQKLVARATAEAPAPATTSAPASAPTPAPAPAPALAPAPAPGRTNFRPQRSRPEGAKRARAE